MNKGGLNALMAFLEESLGFRPMHRDFASYSLIQAEGLPFHIHYYPDSDSPTQTGSSDKTVHLREAQIRRMPEKLFARLKVQAGQGRRIYARDTVVARIDKGMVLEFLQEQHLQVALPGKYRYGLFLAGELVSVAVFAGGRRMPEKGTDYRSFELLRFCHKGDLLVVGGLSKLIKRFVADFNPQDIMTYVDLDWTQDSSLQGIGFNIEKTLAPQQFWITDQNQIPIHSPQDILICTEKAPGGYLHYNSGSTKLVLYL